jgi:hypothetical protein
MGRQQEIVELDDEFVRIIPVDELRQNDEAPDSNTPCINERMRLERLSHFHGPHDRNFKQVIVTIHRLFVDAPKRCSQSWEIYDKNRGKWFLRQ